MTWNYKIICIKYEYLMDNYEHKLLNYTKYVNINMIL